MAALVEHMSAITADAEVVNQAIDQKNSDDYEDGIDYFSAKKMRVAGLS